MTIVKQLSLPPWRREGLQGKNKKSKENAEKAEIIEILRMVDTMKIMTRSQNPCGQIPS